MKRKRFSPKKKINNTTWFSNNIILSLNDWLQRYPEQEHSSSCGDLITKMSSREFPDDCLKTSKGNTTEEHDNNIIP